jgi:alpha-amylase
MQAVVRVDEHAAVVEFDAYERSHNFGDTLRRYDEAYHDKLGEVQQAAAEHGGIASAHDRIAFRHEIAPGDTEADLRPRSLFIEYLHAPNGAAVPVTYHLSDVSERQGAVSFVAEIAQGGTSGFVAKTIEVAGPRLAVRLSAERLAGQLSTRINLAMPSCDGFLGRYVLASGQIPCGFGEPLELPIATQLTLEDGVLGGRLRLTTTLPARISARPHRTVSQSEAGFEKVMQAVEITLSWPIVEGSEQVAALEFEPLA